MITETLLSFALSQVQWLAGLVPDFGLDLSTLDFTDFWAQVGSVLAGLNGWVPALVALVVLGVLLTVQVAISGWGALVWVYHQFWGAS